LEFLATAIRQEEEIKRNTYWKESSQTVPICIWHDLIPKITEKLKLYWNTIKSFSKVARYKINLQKSVAFLYTNNEQIEKKYRKKNSLSVASKN
jgi:hypothetical protein